ncbi:MAG: amidohydrolase family protein [Lachnospiraceae bacterium]|nr:amidohydrolase family protein [Lachnospiraceae bacterium]
MIKIIDTHVHMWDLSKFSLPWLDLEAPILNQTYLLDDYCKEVENHSLYEVEKIIYVEVDCAKEQKEKENEYIIALCNNPNTICHGACIAGNLEDPKFQDYIDKWSEFSSFVKGVRQVLHVSSEAPKTCLKNCFIENVRYLGKKNLLFEGCVRNEELCDLLSLAKLCPDTKIVLNHMGIVNPTIIAKTSLTEEEKKYKETWINNIQQLASLGNVWCKISGLNPVGDWSDELLKPTIDFVIDAFGEDKIMFASNYPVCNVSTYAHPWIKSLIRITNVRGKILQNKLFYDNAKKLYKI